jgi:hypothetical protein
MKPTSSFVVVSVVCALMLVACGDKKKNADGGAGAAGSSAASAGTTAGIDAAGTGGGAGTGSAGVGTAGMDGEAGAGSAGMGSAGVGSAGTGSAGTGSAGGCGICEKLTACCMAAGGPESSCKGAEDVCASLSGAAQSAANGSCRNSLMAHAMQHPDLAECK